MEIDAVNKQRSMSPEAEDELFALQRPLFARLVRFAEERRIPLVVWQPGCGAPAQPPCPRFFEPFRESPAVSFVDWGDVITIARSRGLEVPDDWSTEPTLVFVGDGHPLAAANELFAMAIGDRILAIEAAAGPTAAPLRAGDDAAPAPAP